MAKAVCSKKDWLAIKVPAKDSHKGENGRLMIFAGSPTYHGSLSLAIKAAVRFCDLVYVYSASQNEELLNNLKMQSPNIIILNPRTIQLFFGRIDAFLAGPGWEQNKQNEMLLEKILKTEKPAAIDATALRILKPQMMHEKVLITPHAQEFEALFLMPANEENAKAMAKKYKCTILLKGTPDFICSARFSKENRTHHVGMTKGGTGDVLCGLAGALLSCGNSPYKSACAGAFLSGYSGLKLSGTMGAHYSSEDLVNYLPIGAKEIEDFGKGKKIKQNERGVN